MNAVNVRNRDVVPRGEKCMALPLAYHWRNLLARRTTTFLTVLVVASVVATFAWMFSFTLALRRTLSVAGDPEKMVVLRRGSTSEAQSAVTVTEFNRLSQIAEMARGEGNQPLLSPEILVQVRLPRRRDNGESTANLAVRGVLPVALQVHANVQLCEGRFFSEGAPEVIIGATAARQFLGLEVGSEVELGFAGDRSYRVVGHFTADGGPLESEIWGYLPSLLNTYNRTQYSSATLRLRPGTNAAAVAAQIEGPTIQLAGLTESEYWSSQSRIVNMYLMVAAGLVVVMFIAAVFSVAITMFSAVAGRTREIGMLRTLGFSRAAILGGFVIEAVLLSLLGAVLGCAACGAWLGVVGGEKDVYGASTFTTLAFDIHLTGWTVLGSLACVVLLAVVGALAPAWRASRVEIITVLRQA